MWFFRQAGQTVQPPQREVEQRIEERVVAPQQQLRPVMPEVRTDMQQQSQDYIEQMDGKGWWKDESFQ